MKRLNDGQCLVSDPVGVKRVAFVIEASEVGKTQPLYLGQEPYTFQEDDVGRLVEVITGFSPGFMSWGFGSNFKELREQYPETKPYVTE